MAKHKITDTSPTTLKAGDLVYIDDYQSSFKQLWQSSTTGDVIFTDDKGRDIKLAELIDMSDRLEAIEKRLAILPEPDPEQLEKHKALRQAYNKYKFIEGLLGEDD